MWFKNKENKVTDLIEGCIRNERKAQESLYNLMFDKMYAVCAKYTKDEEVALTILNDGFLKVFKNIHTYSFEGSFEGWVRKIVYRSVADHFRSMSNKIAFLLPGEDMQEPNFDAGILDNLISEDIIKLLEILPATSSKVLVLFAIEGFSHKEIGKMLDINESTSKWHVSHARQLLKEKLKDLKQYKNIIG